MGGGEEGTPLDLGPPLGPLESTPLDLGPPPGGLEGTPLDLGPPPGALEGTPLDLGPGGTKKMVKNFLGVIGVIFDGLRAAIQNPKIKLKKKLKKN